MVVKCVRCYIDNNKLICLTVVYIVVDDMRNSEFEKRCCCKIRIGNESGTVLSENLRTPSDCCLNVADLDYSETLNIGVTLQHYVSRAGAFASYVWYS